MMTERQKAALYALLDQAQSGDTTLQDLARRLGLKSRSSSFRVVEGLKARGLYSAEPRPTFSSSAFRFIPFGEKQNGSTAR